MLKWGHTPQADFFTEYSIDRLLCQYTYTCILFFLLALNQHLCQSSTSYVDCCHSMADEWCRYLPEIWTREPGLTKWNMLNLTTIPRGWPLSYPVLDDPNALFSCFLVKLLRFVFRGRNCWLALGEQRAWPVLGQHCPNHGSFSRLTKAGLQGPGPRRTCLRRAALHLLTQVKVLKTPIKTWGVPGSH